MNKILEQRDIFSEPPGIHVVAKPMREVMLMFSDTNASRSTQARVMRRGLCGDVYLVATPAGPRITGSKIDPAPYMRYLTDKFSKVYGF